MIQGMIIKKVLDLVMKQLLKQFKLDKIQEYVEQPNDADKRIDSLEKKIKKLETAIKGKTRKIKERF